MQYDVQAYEVAALGIKQIAEALAVDDRDTQGNLYFWLDDERELRLPYRVWLQGMQIATLEKLVEHEAMHRRRRATGTRRRRSPDDH